MNLKFADKAIEAYRAALSDKEQKQLDLFRALWGAANEHAAEAESYALPTERALRACWKKQTPVLSEHPLAVDIERLADAMEAVACAAIAANVYDEGFAAALGKCNWQRIVRASNTDLAGSDPAAYLDDLADVLADDALHLERGGGKSYEWATMGAILALIALRSQLEAPAAALMAAIEKAKLAYPHPLACPVCGGAPTLARVGGSDDGLTSRDKTLWCAACGAHWDFERIRCARCGTQNQSHLHYFNIEGDDAHRIATCDECGGYVRTVYSEGTLMPFSYEVEDVVMARLDAVANDPALACGAAVGTNDAPAS